MRWAFWKRGPSELEKLNARVSMALEILDSEQLFRRDARRQKIPCGVFLLAAREPDEGPGRNGMREPGAIISSHCVWLTPGEAHSGTFTPQQSVPKGAWIVAWGPCNVTAVQVGTRSQDMFPESLGPATVLADSAYVGCRIGFTLKAWEYPTW